MIDQLAVPTPAAGGTIRTLTSESFSSLVLEAAGPVVVEFMSYGCAHCRVIEPILQQVAKLVQRTARVFRVNVAVEHALAETYEIQGTPTLIMFLDGEPRGRAQGPSPTVSNVMALVTQSFA